MQPEFKSSSIPSSAKPMVFLLQKLPKHRSNPNSNHWQETKNGRDSQHSGNLFSIHSGRGGWKTTSFSLETFPRYIFQLHPLFWGEKKRKKKRLLSTCFLVTYLGYLTGAFCQPHFFLPPPQFDPRRLLLLLLLLLPIKRQRNRISLFPLSV